MKLPLEASLPYHLLALLVLAVFYGIYAYSRNPAFLGFDLQYIGVLLMYCNLLTGMFTVFAIVMLHLQIIQEENYLTAAFGAEYLEYRHRVLRYLGRRKDAKPDENGKQKN